MQPKLEVVFFDAGHTLLEPDPPVAVRYARTAAEFGAQAPHEEVRKRFARLWREGQAARERGLFRTDDEGTKRFWREFVSEVLAPWFHDINDYEGFFQRLYEDFATKTAWRLFDDVLPGLTKIKELGFRLGVISNWDPRLSLLLESLDVAKFFESIISSAEVGYEKPAGEIFHRALDIFEVPPSRAVHVGDSLNDDVQGALEAGLQAVHLDRGAGRALVDSEEAPSQLDDYLTVSSITELAHQLE